MAEKDTVKKMISANNVMLKAIDDMGMEDFRDAPVLHTWIEDGEKAIDSAYQYKECIHVLDVDDCTVTLPKGTVEVMCLLFGDLGTDCDTFFNEVCYGGRVIDNSNADEGEVGFTIIETDHRRFLCETPYKVLNGKIVFEDKISFSKVTVKLQMFHYDSNGDMMIMQEHEKALSYYIQLKLAERARWNKNTGISRGDINDLQQRWDFYCKQARAISARQTRAEERAGVAMWNNAVSGHGIRYQDRHGGAVITKVIPSQ